MADKKNILVVGGGIGGISTALEAAETGYKVILVEREAFLGGRVARTNKYFPKICPSTCGLEINFRRIKQNPNITVYTLAEVKHVSGDLGKYEVTLTQAPRYVNEKCTACGECEKVCESTRKNDFNLGLDETKAIYLPFEMAYPFRYILDKEACSDDDQKKIVEACKYDAIDVKMQTKEITLSVGSIVLASGWKPYDAAKLDNLGYGSYQNVITNVMMERIANQNGPTKGAIVRPSDKKAIRTIAFVQCAGSRDENHLPYCSAVCCMASLKQAGYVREQYKDAKIIIFYIDIRTPGKFEDFFTKAKADENLILKKGKVAKILEEPSTQSLVVEAEDVLSGVKHRETVDMVVLATGMQPQNLNGSIPGVTYDENGFALCGPFHHAVGCVKRPSDVAKVTQDATGMALKAIQDIIKL